MPRVAVLFVVFLTLCRSRPLESCLLVLADLALKVNMLFIFDLLLLLLLLLLLFLLLLLLLLNSESNSACSV
jgi:hypothetical protein